MNRYKTLPALLILALSLGAQATRLSADQEARFKTLTTELRCLVCQNQTIADSNAALAVDLRNEVQRMLAAGSSDAQIIEFMTARYGDFVLYRPPVKSTTLLLWAAPALFALLGLGGWGVLIRKGRRETVVALSDQERARAATLLAERAHLRINHRGMEERQA